MPNLDRIAGRTFAAMIVFALLGAASSPVAAESGAGRTPLAEARSNPGSGNATLACGGARIGNDARSLSGRGGKPAHPTAYYHLGSALRGNEASLGVGGKPLRQPALVSLQREPARRWLVTVVGAGLHQISTCVDGAALCLEVSNGTGGVFSAELAPCSNETYGSQVWWTKEDGKGSSTIGNDGVGFMSCLAAMPEGAAEGSLQLGTCRPDDPAHLWRFERAG